MAGLFGGRETGSQQRQRRSRENIRKGKAAEEWAKSQYEVMGWEGKRTGKGEDFEFSRRDIRGKLHTKHVEVKAEPASPRRKPRLSKLQKETKAKKRNYEVKTVYVPPFMY